MFLFVLFECWKENNGQQALISGKNFWICKEKSYLLCVILPERRISYNAIQYLTTNQQNRAEYRLILIADEAVGRATLIEATFRKTVMGICFIIQHTDSSAQFRLSFSSRCTKLRISQDTVGWVRSTDIESAWTISGHCHNALNHYG